MSRCNSLLLSKLYVFPICRQHFNHLRPSCLRQGGRTVLCLGDVAIEYNANFRLYLTTELSNPHFQADTAIKVNLINFTVTRRGLEEQFLGEVGYRVPE